MFDHVLIGFEYAVAEKVFDEEVFHLYLICSLIERINKLVLMLHF